MALKYKLLREQTAAALNGAVEKHLGDGWDLYFGPVLYPQENCMWMAQAVVKDPEVQVTDKKEEVAVGNVERMGFRGNGKC